MKEYSYRQAPLNPPKGPSVMERMKEFVVYHRNFFMFFVRLAKITLFPIYAFVFAWVWLTYPLQLCIFSFFGYLGQGNTFAYLHEYKYKYQNCYGREYEATGYRPWFWIWLDNFSYWDALEKRAKK